MPTLTIFTAPKPFSDPHIAIIQCNAIRSWKSLGDQVEVLLIGDEPGMAEAAQSLGVAQLAEVGRNEWGTPTISSIFALAREHSHSPFLCYANADILLLPDLLQAANQVGKQAEAFLMIGKRWDLDVRQELEFEKGWAQSLMAEVQARGRPHPPMGSDYFVFPRSCFADLPEFAVGRAGWDNWMIYHARRQGWTVVDASRAVTAIHQDHDYSHLPGGKPHYGMAESDANRALAGGKVHMYQLIDASHRLVDGSIQPAQPSLARMLRRVELWLTPAQVKPQGARWALAQRLRRLWVSFT